MKTYMDCGKTGEEIAEVIGDVLDLLLDEFVEKIDINAIVAETKKRHPDWDEEAWKAIGFGMISQDEFAQMVKSEEVIAMLDSAKTQLALAYTVSDDEEETDEE